MIDDLAAIFWRKIDERITEQANQMLQVALSNLRPGGAHPLVVEVASPSASTSQPVAKINVLYPAWIDSVDLYANPTDTGSATVDLHVVRPGNALTAGASICGGSLPRLISATSTHFVPTTGWTRFLERNAEGYSVLMPYITSAANITSLTISVNVRAL